MGPGEIATEKTSPSKERKLPEISRRARLAPCRETSNVCVIGAVGFPPRKEDHIWALSRSDRRDIAPRSNHEEAGTGYRP